MKVLIDKAFEKDIEGINNKKLRNLIADCIEQIQKVEKLTEIPNCKKLKGSKNAYRVRLANYKIVFVFENQTIEFVRFLHRSNIYNFFPD
jgi:mRNA interferase RelE/StbE